MLKATEILNYDCVFCRTNAANSEVSRIPVFERKGYAAFEDMFYERPDVTRTEMGIPSCFTTDPQAEILVCNNIFSDNIDCVCVENVDDKDYLNSKGIIACVKQDYFAPRCDYSRW